MLKSKHRPSHESLRVVPLHRHKKKIALKNLQQGEETTELFNPSDPSLATINAQLTYQGGILLPNVEVFTVFWGSAFDNGALSNLPDKINLFFDTILQGALMDQLAEYSTGNYNIGKGTLVGSTLIAEDLPKNISDSDIQTQLQDWISNHNTFPQPTSNTLYFVYVQNGVSVTMGGGNSCSSFCGYHNNIGNDIFYAVMPYPDCEGCLAKLSVFDALTGTSSHELCEAITDPVPGTGWYDNINNMEIGDICAWQFKTLEGYNVQLEWSNSANKCI